MENPPLDALARLRHDDLARSPFYPGGPAALTFHRDMLARASEAGVIALVEEGSEILAFAARWVEPDSFTGEPVEQLMVHRRDSEAGLAAGMVCADRVMADAAEDVRATLARWDTAIRRHLEGWGLGLLSVNLAGRREDAVAGLGPVVEPAWLEIARVQAEDVDGVLALYAQVFRDEPLYAPFGAHPRFLEGLRETLLADSGDDHWALRESGRLIGYAATRYRMTDPHHGSSAGVELVFSRAARGRGLARVLYGRVLTSMAARGVAWMKGTTARPQVLSLAAKLGRGITGVNLSRKNAFPAGWFEGWLA